MQLAIVSLVTSLNPSCYSLQILVDEISHQAIHFNRRYLFSDNEQLNLQINSQRSTWDVSWVSHQTFDWLTVLQIPRSCGYARYRSNCWRPILAWCNSFCKHKWRETECHVSPIWARAILHVSDVLVETDTIVAGIFSGTVYVARTKQARQLELHWQISRDSNYCHTPLTLVITAVFSVDNLLSRAVT